MIHLTNINDTTNRNSNYACTICRKCMPWHWLIAIADGAGRFEVRRSERRKCGNSEPRRFTRSLLETCIRTHGIPAVGGACVSLDGCGRHDLRNADCDPGRALSRLPTLPRALRCRLSARRHRAHRLGISGDIGLLGASAGPANGRHAGKISTKQSIGVGRGPKVSTAGRVLIMTCAAIALTSGALGAAVGAQKSQRIINHSAPK